MRIAVILPSLGNLGPVIIARQLVQRLLISEEVDVYYFDEILELDFPCTTRKISFREEINFSNYDIVHSHMLRPDLYLAYHSSKIPKRTKTVSTIHQESFKDLSMKYNRFVAYFSTKLWHRVLHSFSQVVSLNKIISSQLPLEASKISVIGNGVSFPIYEKVDLEDENALANFTKNFKKIIGSSSNLINRKGLDQIIKVLIHFPDTGYLVIGEGPERMKLEKLSHELGVENQCLFMGKKLKGYRYFKYFDIYMLTSHSEGFPICAIEAAQASLPIVSSEIDVLTEIFNADEVAFFELENIQSLKEALDYAYQNRNELSRKIRDKYNTQLSDKNMSDNYLNLFRKLLSSENREQTKLETKPF